MTCDSSLSRVISVIERLLAPDGCPWDREQTPESLCDYVVEEAFELVESIRARDTAGVMEELGDVLFLLLFIATLAERRGDFSLSDALEANAAKMIRRHPHVFADASFTDQKELLKNWERIKRQEKQADGPSGVFDSLPRGLPPLLRAYRINSKAARFGFTWDSDEDVKAQMDAEWQEFCQAQDSGSAEETEREFGDFLFTLVEYGRRKGVKANAALDKANNTFLSRFARMEELAGQRDLDLGEMSLEGMNGLWDEAKKSLP